MAAMFGMVQGRQGAGLAVEAGQALGVLGEMVGQDLERHLAAQLGVLGQVDGAHAAFAEFAEDFVVGQSLADHLSALLLEKIKRNVIHFSCDWGNRLSKTRYVPKCRCSGDHPAPQDRNQWNFLLIRALKWPIGT